ncbi:hypothetical protein [Shewanella xiamenensis]|uniref:hypothetical protein n=1 Tax=Shewanella xiamenensis TaxID=332186 RepID=UPI002E7AD08A|nr:hypothetical protein [Shewanella xiamenensis]MEE1978913.1 hypothetical protein [Shewanella xiamenensis]
MHTVTFYPVGNGDTSLIKTTNGRFILMDFHQMSNAEDDKTPQYDINAALRQELKDADKESFDVVAFTHADKDHINGSTKFFHLEHAEKYQGGDRVEIDELWVPAAMLLEEADNLHQSEESVVWRQEARHRLKNKSGIKVFSTPDDLKKLIQDWGMTVDELSKHLIDAGTLVDTFNLGNDGVEFFVHSPFMKHCDVDGKDVKQVRNEASLIFNVRFNSDGETYDYLAVGDSEAEVLEDIVEITKWKANDDRLAWDLFNIPHHCSYLALALSGDKGKDKTVPLPKVKELLEMGKQGSYMICSSKAFGSGNAAKESVQPPHIQAKACYEEYLQKVKGRKFVVTSENGGTIKPKPVVIKIEKAGVSMIGAAAAVSTAALAAAPARAGGVCDRFL